VVNFKSFEFQFSKCFIGMIDLQHLYMQLTAFPGKNKQTFY